MIQDIAIVPFDDQKPGTSGLRKTTARFSLPHYLESFVQSLFDTAPSLSRGTLVLGGEIKRKAGSYYQLAIIQAGQTVILE